MSDKAFGDRIVQNLLDTDFYKLTMMQAVLHGAAQLPQRRSRMGLPLP